MAAPPKEVLHYMELLERRKQIKAEYRSHVTNLNEQINSIQPHVGEWLKHQPNQTLNIDTATPGEQQRWGIKGKLYCRVKDEIRPLTHDRLDILLHTFFERVLLPKIQLGEQFDLAHMATLCADYIWVNRQKTRKETVLRTYSERKRVQRD